MDNKIIPAFLIAAAIFGSAALLTTTLKDISRNKQTINVTGSAKRNIVSDRGKIGFSVLANASTQMEAMREISRQKPLLTDFLTSKGIRPEQLAWRPVISYPVYQTNDAGYQTGKILSYNLTQEVFIESDNVSLIENISLDAAQLLEKGLQINIYPPEYYYTQLANIKIDIQAEAAADARNRASKIAEATGRKIGPLTSARMGVLQITPELSNMVSDYGVNDNSSIRKEITAVVNATFLIE